MIDKTTIERINGYLHRIIPITDASGEVISHMLKPLSVEFKPRDMMQTVVGSTFLAIPITYTEEAWTLGEKLPLVNVGLIALMSFTILSIFIYLNYYRYQFKGFEFEFVKRVLFTYIVSLLTVAILLTVVDKAPWETNLWVAIKRVVIIAFPATMSATLTDLIK